MKFQTIQTNNYKIGNNILTNRLVSMPKQGYYDARTIDTCTLDARTPATLEQCRHSNNDDAGTWGC